jgi:hypothetical protein
VLALGICVARLPTLPGDPPLVELLTLDLPQLTAPPSPPLLTPTRIPFPNHLSPPLISLLPQAFTLWAKDEAAVYLEFIVDINDMKNDPVKMSQTMKVISIFTKYIPARSAKKKLNIDKATRDTIMMAFESKCYDYAVFDLAYEKAYQCLKFDYMPQFLISEEFVKLENRTQVRRGSSTKIIELKAIMSEPPCMRALTTFLRTFGEPKMLSYVRLWEAISDFKLDYAKQSGEDQNKSSKKLWDNIQSGVDLPSHLRVTTNDNVNGNKNSGAGPGQDCFDDLQDFLCDMLQATVQRPFLVSREYTDFLNSATDEYKVDSVVLTLSEFTDDRQLNKTREDYEVDLNNSMMLENVLSDQLLSAYFRRFLRLSFQEENFCFFQDVQDMKIQQFVKSASSEITGEMSLQEILEVSAMKIFDKYVKAGAMYQVNVSGGIRDIVVEKISDGKISEDIYDDAQREIFMQMRSGGFMEFKKHDLFAHFKKAHKHKFMQRNFAVGDKKKSQKPVFEHNLRKESGFVFEQAMADTSFDLDEHIRNKKGKKTFGNSKLDFITAQNVKDFGNDISSEMSGGESSAGRALENYSALPDLSTASDENGST